METRWGALCACRDSGPPPSLAGHFRVPKEHWDHWCPAFLPPLVSMGALWGRALNWVLDSVCLQT